MGLEYVVILITTMTPCPPSLKHLAYGPRCIKCNHFLAPSSVKKLRSSFWRNEGKMGATQNPLVYPIFSEKKHDKPSPPTCAVNQMWVAFSNLY